METLAIADFNELVLFALIIINLIIIIIFHKPRGIGN